MKIKQIDILTADNNPNPIVVPSQGTLTLTSKEDGFYQLDPTGQSNKIITQATLPNKVSGPLSSNVNTIPTFSDTTGQIIQDSNLLLSGTTSLTVTTQNTDSANLIINAYNNPIGSGASLQLLGGTSTTSIGGTVAIRGGAGSAGPTTNGGNVNINGGNSNTTGNGSAVSLTAGSNNGSGAGGTTTVSGGVALGAGAGGITIIRGGRGTTSGVPGEVQVRYGNTTSATVGMRLDKSGNVFLGTAAALATTATDGFVSIPTCSGVPTGTPTLTTGLSPLVYDSSDKKLYIFSGGSWNIVGS